MKKRAMQIHPIKSEEDYERAVARIGQLMSAAPETAEGDELDVLATLVDAYEAKHYGMDAPDPVAAIQFRMEQQGLTRKDLEPMIGSRARVSEILNRRRNLTLEMVRRLKFDLGISADSLIGSTMRTSRHHAYANSAHKAHSAQKLTRKRIATTASRVKKAVGS
jgi:HTH-type transcriptional regulator / antitoxin HigA